MKLNNRNKLLLLAFIALTASSLLTQGVSRSQNGSSATRPTTNQPIAGKPDTVAPAGGSPSPNKERASHPTIASMLSPSSNTKTSSRGTVSIVSTGPRFAGDGSTEQ